MNKSMTKRITLLVVGFLIGFGLYSTYQWHQQRKSNDGPRETKVSDYSEYAVATFAGGCFWCTEADFEKTDGVVEAISGYTGGDLENPTYKQVSSGSTEHVEAVQVYYDPEIVTYDQLLDVFWRHADPTDAGGSFVARGEHYVTEIFVHDGAQRESAEASKEALASSGVFDQPIVTPISDFKHFWPAEDYHQNYYLRNARPYGFYRGRSGRDDYVAEVWGGSLKKAQEHAGGDKAKKDLKKEPKKVLRTENLFLDVDYKNFVMPSDDVLKQKLTPLQYDVTRHEGTERPFHNDYWDNKKDGIYVDIISGEPLYSSTDKYDSGTGWPSFYKPIGEGVVTEHDDYKLIVHRTEIRSAIADNHIGHIILDGPEWNNFVRHCMNSAAMRFVPVEEMEAQGYGEFLSLFDGS